MADFDGWTLTISKDNMSGILHMEPPVDRNPYTVDEAVHFIKSNGVSNGIVFSAVEEAVELRKYYKDIEVARGKDPVNGIDGYYEFFFEQGALKHPVIRSDGSVDYSSMTVVRSVKKGDKLVTYHPAVPGTHGYDLKGRELRCKPGKEMPEIRGSGFDKSFDGLTLIANMDGRVDYKDYKLNVCDKYELKGDLDLVTGRIDFLGDVIVHGNVLSGTTIRASKSITVEGSVEAATLIAEGDIILKKGMQGGKRAKIVCGGNLYANFIEFTDVSVKGNIEANIAMNCKLSSGKSIKISGKRGSIVGGSTYAVSSISTANLGNRAEAKTEAVVGVTEELDKKNHMLHVKADSTTASIRKAKAELELLSDARIDGESKEVKAAKRSQLQRRIKRDERVLEHVNAELSEIDNTMVMGKNASVNVTEKAYPGCKVAVGNKNTEVTSEMEGTTFYANSESPDVQTRNY